MAAVLLLALVTLPMACRRNTELVSQPGAAEFAPPHADATKNELVLTISKDGELTLQKEPVTFDNLNKKLADAVRGTARPSLTIQAHKAAHSPDLVKALEAAKAAGINLIKVTNTSSPKAEGAISAPATSAPDIHTTAGDILAEGLGINHLPMADAIRQLAGLAGLNIQFDPALLNQKTADGSPIPPSFVTEKWKQATPLQAMQALLNNYGWQLTQIPGNPIFRVVSTNPKTYAEAPAPPAFDAYHKVLTKLADLQNKEALLESRYTTNYPLIQTNLTDIAAARALKRSVWRTQIRACSCCNRNKNNSASETPGGSSRGVKDHAIPFLVCFCTVAAVYDRRQIALRWCHCEMEPV